MGGPRDRENLPPKNQGGSATLRPGVDGEAEEAQLRGPMPIIFELSDWTT
jgi:hypothetical protein